eukprot:6178575-Pleurochrysis_carterae.AAC.12
MMKTADLRAQPAAAAGAQATAAATAIAAGERPNKRRNKGYALQPGYDTLCAVLYSFEKDVPADKNEKRPWRGASEKAKEAAALEAEMFADRAALGVIRRRFGENSEQISAMLLTFNALFESRNIKRHRFDCNCLSKR